MFKIIGGTVYVCEYNRSTIVLRITLEHSSEIKRSYKLVREKFSKIK